MTSIELDISSEKARFKEHLELLNNNQIIFSGIFGIGKTYFLEKFFESEKEKYETITISPVNYSISNNDDIIDYIKYDIIFQLLAKGIDFEKTDFSKGLTSQMYLKDNFKDVMKILLKNASKINRQFSVIFDSLNQINIELVKYNHKINVDEEKELTDFLTQIKDKTGAIYEENRITCLIAKLIEGLKFNNKEVLLVIDDTDRLDPEHVFRILNVFACHFEFENLKENKFSFDKVILVCDVDNVRKMFHNRYGQNVDFTGYIDKFFSQEIHYFDNKLILRNNLKEILKHTIQNKRDFDDFYLLGNKNVTVLLYEILDSLISLNLINLRVLTNLVGKGYNVPRHYFKLNNNKSDFSNRNFDVLLIFDFLSSLFGSVSGLTIALKRLKEEYREVEIDFYDHLDKYSDLIRFLREDVHDHKSEKTTYDYSIIDLNVKFKYEYERQSYRVFLRNIEITDLNGEKRNTIPFYSMLFKAYEKYSIVNNIRK